MAQALIDIRLLGGFHVSVNGQPIPRERWRHLRAAQLVQLLGLSDQRRLRREQVIDTLWPDLAPEAGAANLRKAAHLARQVLGTADAIVLAGGDVSLAPGATVRVDATVFANAASSALEAGGRDACVAASGLYTGTLLPEAIYESWTAEPRARLRQLYLDLLRAGEAWDRLADEDPTDEPAHRELMRRDLAAGNRASALGRYARLESALRLHLGVVPDEETRHLRDACVGTQPVSERTFVGRKQELAKASRWLQQTMTERAGGLVVSGPAGIGKTALCGQIAILASRLGHRVVSITAHESAPAFGAALAVSERVILEQRSLLDTVGDAARTVLAQLTPLAEPAAAPQGPLGRHQVFGAIRRLLIAASGGAPILLHVDDAHLLGPADMDLLLDLAVTGKPVFVMLALRPLPDHSPLDRRLARLAHANHVTTIRLGPLSDVEARELLASADPLAPDVATKIVSSAQGSPFMALELAGCGGITAGTPLPETTRAAILTRLCDVTEPAKRLLDRLALADDEFDAATIAAVSDSDEAATFTMLDTLLATGVLTVSGARYRFRHELVRQCVLDGVPPHQRLEAHRAIARGLAHLHAAPALIAQHWLAGGSPEEAAPYLIEAARTAVRIGAFVDALGHVDKVLDWHRKHVEALRLRAEALDGRGERAAVQAYREAAEVADPQAADDLRAKGALAQIKMGDPAGALKALETVSPASPEGRLAEALAYCGAAAMGVSPPERGTERAAAARRLALDTGDTAAIVIASWAHAAVAHARGELHGSVWADLYDTRNVPHLAVRVFDGQLCITQRLLYGSRPYADVIAFATALAAESERLGAARGHAFGVTLRGEAHLLSGNLDAAEDDLRRGARLHHAIGGATGEAFSLQRLSELAMLRGDWQSADALLDDALDIARQTDIGFHLLDRIYGTRITLSRTPEAALAALLEAEEKVRGPLETCPGCRITLEVPAAIAAARAGEMHLAEAHAQAAEYLADVVMRLPAWYAAMDEVRGHLARARGESALVVSAHFAAAASAFRKAGHPLDAVRCEAESGRRQAGSIAPG